MVDDKHMLKKLKSIWRLISQTFNEWSQDNAAQLSAALAYYTIFSLSPILIIALAVAGQFFNQDTARNQLMAQISSYMGQETAQFLGSILQNSGRSSSSFIASSISFIVLLIGASGVFGQVQFSLNRIWKVPPPNQRSLKSNIKNRVLSFLIVLGIGFLLLVFLVISGILSSINTSTNGNTQVAFLFQTIDFIILFGLMTVMFAMIFRIVPDKDITWKDVWLGAAITALLFVFGRYAISLYLTLTKSGSTYGAAGSLVVLLIWIYYSAQIFLLGAEFTQVYAKMFGSHKTTVGNSEDQPEQPPVNQRVLRSE